MELNRKRLQTPLTDRLTDLSGQSIRGCYQCGRCSAGCPTAPDMADLPHRVMRWLQLGNFDRALASPTIWLCASCHTCAARCPRGVDLSRIMEAARVHLLRKQLAAADLQDMTRIQDGVPQQALVGGLRKFSH